MFPPHDANRLGLDYRKEAAKLTALPYPIIDAHMHINSGPAAAVYMQAARAYGIALTYSMTYLENIPAVREVLGDSVRFIAMPRFTDEERLYSDVPSYMRLIEDYYSAGARIIKFWSAPRGIDIGRQFGLPDLLRLNSTRRQEIMRQASAMGMIFMVHVGDPDTWFATKYKDASVYASKRDHYTAFEELLVTFSNPWIAAHMGGWPEDLEFLAGLLQRHPNLYLDSSATKWIVRELSKHSLDECHAFFTKWRGRILFGSDIVVKGENLVADERQQTLAAGDEERAIEIAKAEAFELYASRYWALRTLFESDYDGPSPISDPDLALVEPDKYNKDATPKLRGKALPPEVIESLYNTAACALFDKVY